MGGVPISFGGAAGRRMQPNTPGWDVAEMLKQIGHAPGRRNWGCISRHMCLRFTVAIVVARQKSHNSELREKMRKTRRVCSQFRVLSDMMLGMVLRFVY